MQKFAFVIGALFFLSGCGAASEFHSADRVFKSAEDTLATTDPVVPIDTSDPLAVVLKYKGNTWVDLSYEDYGISEYDFANSPSWETGITESWRLQAVSYTQYAAFIVDHFAGAMVDGSHALTSTNSFCPKYNRFSRMERIEFWVHFVSAVTKFESGYKPNMRYFESTFGYKDSVTQEAVYSEGLLQLSYQDGKNYKECGQVFSWEQDKVLSRTSLEKTIFDPMRNLYCGISIMNRIMKSKKTLFYDSGHYWAVLKPNGKYGKVDEITKMVQDKNPKCF